MPFETFVDELCFILAEHAPEAMYGGHVRVYFLGVQWPANVKCDLGQSAMTQMLHAARFPRQKIRLRLKSLILLPKESELRHI